MRILLLCDYRPFNAATVTDHINAFIDLSVHQIFVYSGLVMNQGRLPEDIDLNEFDAVMVHYSIFISIDAYLSPRSRNRLKNFRGIKVVFIQDEYRSVNATVDQLKNMRFDILFTCVPKKEIEKVYPEEKLPSLKKINTLTGYVSAQLLNYKPIPISKRKYDVSYRGRKYPSWHGRMGREKWNIAELFKKKAFKKGLRTNISCKESKRLYGSSWTNLIQDSRAVLGVESGASVFDFTGRIAAKTETITKLLGEKQLKKNKMDQTYYRDHEDKINLAQISPRIFEAIALRTLCVLYEGNYSGVLKPWEHYIPLKKDHSNFDEVVKAIKKDETVAKIITNAYGEIAVNIKYSYNKFIEQFDRELEFLLKSEKTGAGRKKFKFKEPKDFYEKFPFFQINNPYGLVIPFRYRIFSKFVLLFPEKLKMYIKKMIHQG